MNLAHSFYLADLLFTENVQKYLLSVADSTVSQNTLAFAIAPFIATIKNTPQTSLNPFIVKAK